MDKKDIINTITNIILDEYCRSKTDFYGFKKIPVGVSNRHVHLSEKHIDTLFGEGFQLSVMKELSQPGQYASEQRVTLVGPKGVIENVRVLGPARNKTQVEIAVSDSYKLGIKAPLRDSGDLEGSSGVTIVGSKGSVTIDEGVIVAARHIHMHSDDAEKFRVRDGEHVCVKVPGKRGLVFNEVLIRVSDKYNLEMHVDIDEANVASLKNVGYVDIVENQ